ncbi:hypothetical protein GCM10017691_21290 [Pseudonocardia petroleophila]|uniref:Pilus assembly protein n=1 Tax=Pseudonocardia petroleophila TaxID=37331 RepID=A0A7G7MGJ0_9PSEU|nr:pilus assembly protein [Pseudonocardia petroleophila]QNG51901.1 pilus assembly protein [Pseudonocardia petroleophila]
MRAPVPGQSGERGGSPSVEAAVLVVALGLLIAFAVAGGRLVAAEAATDHAARSAARVASLHREPGAAAAAAQLAAESSLAEQGLHCADLRITLDTAGFAAPLGTPASVTATVRCDVEWSDLGLPGASTRVIESTSASPIDRWRERA